MSFIEEIREGGGDIKICGATPKVLQVFEILGFPALFDLLPDVPGAVKRVSRRDWIMVFATLPVAIAEEAP